MMKRIQPLIEACNSHLKELHQALMVWPEQYDSHLLGLYYHMRYRYRVLNVYYSDSMLQHCLSFIDKNNLCSPTVLTQETVESKGCDYTNINSIYKHASLQQLVLSEPYDLLVLYDFHKLINTKLSELVTKLIRESRCRKVVAVAPVPFREDGEGFGQFFHEVTYYNDLLDAVKMKWYRDYMIHEIPVDEKPLFDRLAACLTEDMRRVIIYVESVEMIVRCCNYFRKIGVVLVGVHSALSRTVINQYLDDFMSGVIRGIVTYAMMVERSEAKSADTLFIARTVCSDVVLNSMLSIPLSNNTLPNLSIYDFSDNEISQRLKQFKGRFSSKKREQCTPRYNTAKKAKDANESDEISAISQNITKEIETYLVKVGAYYIAQLGYIKRFILLELEQKNAWLIENNKEINISLSFQKHPDPSLWILHTIEANKDADSFEKQRMSLSKPVSTTQLFYLDQFLDIGILQPSNAKSAYDASAMISYGFYQAFKDHISLRYLSHEHPKTLKRRVKVEHDGSIIGVSSIDDVVNLMGKKGVYVENKWLYKIIKYVAEQVDKKELIMVVDEGDIHQIGGIKYDLSKEISAPFLLLMESFCRRINVDYESSSDVSVKS